MATEMKVWQVSKADGLVAVEENFLEANHLESELEEWIAENPAILGDDLLVIDQQYPMDAERRLDLLCLDSTGAFVIVELKRGRTPREAVAQALDYASWFNEADELTIEEIRRRADDHLKQPLDQAFMDHFQVTDMPELAGQNHRMVLAAPRLDAAAERIIEYLRTCGVQINAVFFKYARLKGGEEVLVRSVLAPDKPSIPPKKPKEPQPTVVEVLRAADDRQIRPLVEICRRMNSDWDERPAGVYGGKSFVYLARIADAANANSQTAELTVFGIDASGQQAGAPIGELDVWIPVPKLAAAAGTDESSIRDTLGKIHSPIDKDLWNVAAKPPDWENWGAGRKAAWSKKQNSGENFWIRLREPAQAEALVQQLKQWASAGQQHLPEAH